MNIKKIITEMLLENDKKYNKLLKQNLICPNCQRKVPNQSWFKNKKKGCLWCEQ